MPRTRYAREFLEGKFGRRKPRWTTVRPRDVLSFVKGYAQRVRPSSTQVAASSIRCFLRYLQAQGWCGASLVAAVPRIAHWRLSSLPKALSEDQVREFLATFDRSQATGLRDYAMALCQIVLGLRVSEVANLRLDDFNWRTGEVRINAGKVLRTHELPLPVQVGNALVRYLRDGRPATRCRNVFVRHRGACGAPVSTAVIRGAMRLAYAKMRGGTHWGGTHILRHTAATRMLQHGASLKEIADVLGHRSIQTTTIYTKVDLRRLTAVASPWPEVRSMRKRPTMVKLAKEYLAYRRQLGYELRHVGRLLQQFARYADRNGHHGPLTIQLAIRWAKLPRKACRSYWAQDWALFVASPSTARSSILTRRFHPRTPSVGGTAALLRISTAWRKSPPWWRLPASCLPRKA